MYCPRVHAVTNCVELYKKYMLYIYIYIYILFCSMHMQHKELSIANNIVTCACDLFLMVIFLLDLLKVD